MSLVITNLGDLTASLVLVDRMHFSIEGAVEA